MQEENKTRHAAQAPLFPFCSPPTYIEVLGSRSGVAEMLEKC